MLAREYEDRVHPLCSDACLHGGQLHFSFSVWMGPNCVARLLGGFPRLGHPRFAQKQETRLDMCRFLFIAVLPFLRTGIFDPPGLLTGTMEIATNHRSALDSARPLVWNFKGCGREAREPDR